MISDMNTVAQLQRQIQRLQRQLAQLGPIHPGSLSEQFNVCGQPGCRCKADRNPQKHGPYYQLSFTWRGKSRTRFVRLPQLETMREKVANYKRFRELTEQWVGLALALERAEREQDQ